MGFLTRKQLRHTYDTFMAIFIFSVKFSYITTIILTKIPTKKKKSFPCMVTVASENFENWYFCLNFILAAKTLEVTNHMTHQEAMRFSAMYKNVFATTGCIV